LSALRQEQQRAAAAPPPQPDSPPDSRHAAAELLAETPQEVKDEALRLLKDPLLIKGVLDDVAAQGVAGERELVAGLYCVGTSRKLSEPLACIVRGPSSSGKTYAIEKAAKLMPPEETIFAT